MIGTLYEYLSTFTVTSCSVLLIIIDVLNKSCRESQYTHILFYIHGSVHRDSVLIRSKKAQEYAGIYLLQDYSTWTASVV
jgi:hypothetical protein